MKPTSILPDDVGLPGLIAIRAVGLGRAVPGLELGDRPVDLQVVGHSRGLRATLEVRAGDRHFAVKCYSRDPSPEAGFYEALALAGLASNESEVRVPRLLAWERPLMILAISWLEGRSATDLIADGDGARAGELAARWLRRSASLDVKLRAVAAAGEVLARTTHWVEALGAADVSLGSRARGITERLSSTVRDEFSPRIVNGRYYLRHVLDLGGAAGVIDWEHFGLGPLEIDAGMFLATLFRSGRYESRAESVARAEHAFLRGTAGLFDELGLAWHRAAALMSLAYHLLARSKDNWRDQAGAFLDEAERCLTAADAATRSRLAAARRPWPAGVAGSVIAPVRSDVGRADDARVSRIDVAVPDDLASSGAPVADATASGQRNEGPPYALDEVQVALLKLLWRVGEASVHEVVRKLDGLLSHTQVATHLNRLEGQSLITRRFAGRRHVYRAAVDQAHVRRSFVQDFALRADGLFEGDVAELMCQLVRASDVQAKDLARVIDLLKARERELEGGIP